MYMGNQTLQTWQSDCREPCRAYLSPAYTVCLVEADIGMPGLKDAVLFPSDLIDHVAEAYFLTATRKVCSIRSRGVVRNAPDGMLDLSPLLLWSEEKLCSWAISPCFSIHSNDVHGETWRKG